MRLLSFFAVFFYLFSSCANQAESETESKLEADSVELSVKEQITAEIESGVEFTIDTFVQFGEGKVFGNSNNQGEEDLFLGDDNLPKNLNEADFFLRQFIAANRAESIMRSMKLYEKINTDKALINFYKNDLKIITSAILDGMQKSHPDIEYSGDDTQAIAWAWISDYLPLRTACLCSECSSEAYTYLPDLVKKSKSTSGNLDDELFRLLSMYYADYDNTWENIGYGNDGCDYCGYSTFGNGEHIKLFKEINLVAKKTQFLDEELNKLIALMVDFGGTAFKSSQADILKEIDAFLELKDSTRLDVSKFETEKERISKANKSFIFECTYE